MTRRSHLVLALAALALAATLAWWLQNGRPGLGRAPAEAAANAAPPSASRAVTVEVGTVRSARLVDAAEAVGSLRARQGVTLRPEISGRVARISFVDGQRVRRGQLMVQLDDTLQQAQLQQAQAQLGIARTQAQRNRELLAQGFVSQSALDQSAAAVEVASAQVALAQAQLARTRLLAPFDGVAGIRAVDLGAYVKDGDALVDVEDTGTVVVDYRLPERHLAQVQVGAEVEVAIDAIAGPPMTGRVEALDALVDAEGRSLRVRARLANPDGLLRTGMFARVRTVLGVREQALVVPEEALVPEGGKQYLIKVADGPGGPVSQRMEAQLGGRGAGQVEILTGLVPGDRVVTAGQDRLMAADALPLKIVQVGAASASAPAESASAGRPPA